MSQPEIHFNVPTADGDELSHMEDAIGRGHTSSDGHYTRQVRQILGEWFRSEEVILTTSCTDALELSALLLEIDSGDEVIVPSFTFVSTALAFARAGADLVFADIEDEFLSMDPDHVENLISERTKAVVTVHYAGIAPSQSRLLDLTSGPVSLIEDNAHGLFGVTAGQKLGTFGRFSTLSFHETKNFSCGEGGALIVNDGADVDRARVLTDKGTNRRAFFEGQVDKYSWQDTGSSFGLSDLLAAYLLAQLQRRHELMARRQQIFDRYMQALAPLVDELGVQLPVVPADCDPAYHMFYLLVPYPQQRPRMLGMLRDRGIMATFHYVPLHSSPGGQKFSSRSAHLPVTDSVSQRLIRLPFHNRLSDADVERVTSETIKAARASL